MDIGGRPLKEGDFELIESRDDQSRQFEEKLASCFGYRAVTDIKNDKSARKLPVFSGKPAEQQVEVRFEALRSIGRLAGKTKRKQNISFLEPKKITIPVSTGDRSPEELKADIYVSDNDLASDLLPDKKDVFILPDILPVFGSGAIRYNAVRQCDKRATCYLLSGLASYAKSPVGQKLLTDCIKDLGDGYASVTLMDPVFNKEVTIVVSTARLTDAKGNDLYSFRNDMGVCWPAVVEKAFHALKLSRTDTLKQAISASKESGQKEYTAFLEDKFRDIGSLGKDSKLLDHNTLFDAMNCLPRIPSVETEGGSYKQHSDGSIVFPETDLKREGCINTLRFNIEHGVPVVLGTRGGLGGAWNAVRSGTPTKHAVAVLGPAILHEKGSPDGVLIYDTYGSALDGDDVIIKSPTEPASTLKAGSSSEMEGATGITEDFEMLDLPRGQESLPESVITQSAGRSVRFYSYKDLHKYFSSAVVAPGGFGRT